MLKQAKLSRDKLLSNFDIKSIPGLSSTKIQYLAQGEFMDRYEIYLFLVILALAKVILV
ncbi:IS21 family transposase [Rickettsia endosymbiont of Ixodes scapularis]|nr:IS21 family transposase [Rickettsia endosymbiont of Ixodes scapularis]